MSDHSVVQRLADIGTEAVGSTAAELDALARQQFEFYSGIVRANNR
jgi:hypothetical protein